MVCMHDADINIGQILLDLHISNTIQMTCKLTLYQSYLFMEFHPYDIQSHKSELFIVFLFDILCYKGDSL